MKSLTPHRAVVAVLAFTLVCGLLPSAFAGASWKPDTTGSPDQIKIGQSGQVYAWRKGKCWGHPGTWSTFQGKRTLVWCGPKTASTERIMKGMGLKPQPTSPVVKPLVRKTTIVRAKTKGKSKTATAAKAKTTTKTNSRFGVGTTARARSYPAPAPKRPARPARSKRTVRAKTSS